MNYGPIIFLAAFFALATSWFGLVLTPQVQLGRMQPTNNIVDQATYPLSRPGLAREGLDVYRANGCAYCHSQQARQSGVECEIAVTDAGTNQAAAVQALLKIKAVSTPAEAERLLVNASNAPPRIRRGLSRTEADAELKTLEDAGLKTDLLILPIGPDMARAWGDRRSVAEDFLYDYPVMPGSQRIGPDLANVAARQQDPDWHLRHLYAPQSEVAGSVMPPYRYLFEKRRIERARSPDALALTGKLAPEKDFEIVPKREAKALVSYLLSLRADAPLFDAPFKTTVAMPAPATNNVPGSATNSAATNATPAAPPAAK